MVASRGADHTARPALTVPGRFALDALVASRVPVRNDGNRVPRITQIDPG